MISGETMRCCKVRRIFQYHLPNKLLSPEKFDHLVLLIFDLFRHEKEFRSDSEERETNKTSALPYFMPQILPDNEFVEGINSVNLKQTKVFSVIHTCAKDYVTTYDVHNVEPIFFSGSRGTGKSHLVKVINNAVLKVLFCHCKDPEKADISFTWTYRNISDKYRWNHHSFWSWN